MIKVENREEFLIALKGYLPNGCKVAELGVLYGDFSQMILNTINPTTLYLVDPYITTPNRRYGRGLTQLPTAYSTEQDYKKLLTRFEKEISSDHVFVIKDFSHNAVDGFQDNSLDIIYIDACHLYEDNKQDLNDWLPKLKEGGLMCGHDYIQDYKNHVIKAVDEFIEESGFKMVIFNENGGDWALKRCIA